MAINIWTDKYLKKKYGCDANSKYTTEIIKIATDQNFITGISKNFLTNTFWYLYKYPMKISVKK